VRSVGKKKSLIVGRSIRESRRCFLQRGERKGTLLAEGSVHSARHQSQGTILAKSVMQEGILKKDNFPITGEKEVEGKSFLLTAGKGGEGVNRKQYHLHRQEKQYGIEKKRTGRGMESSEPHREGTRAKSAREKLESSTSLARRRGRGRGGLGKISSLQRNRKLSGESIWFTR